jgi:hypothetical protein
MQSRKSDGIAPITNRKVHLFQSDDIEAMVKIFAKRSIVDHLEELCICCTTHVHIDMGRIRTAGSFKSFCSQKSRQSCMCSGINFPNSLEKSVRWLATSNKPKRCSVAPVSPPFRGQITRFPRVYSIATRNRPLPALICPWTCLVNRLRQNLFPRSHFAEK